MVLYHEIDQVVLLGDFLLVILASVDSLAKAPSTVGNQDI